MAADKLSPQIKGTEIPNYQCTFYECTFYEKRFPVSACFQFNIASHKYKEKLNLIFAT